MSLYPLVHCWSTGDGVACDMGLLPAPSGPVFGGLVAVALAFAAAALIAGAWMLASGRPPAFLSRSPSAPRSASAIRLLGVSMMLLASGFALQIVLFAEWAQHQPRLAPLQTIALAIVGIGLAVEGFALSIDRRQRGDRMPTRA